MRARAQLGALAVCALAAGCAGASSPPKGSPAGDAASPSAGASVAFVTAAAAKTLDKRSSRVATTVNSSTGLRLQATGIYEYSRGDAVVDITTTASGRTTKQRMILVRGVAYVNVPGLGSGGNYIKLDLSALAGRSGGTAFDQSTQLNLLRGATDSLRTVGSEPVRGVPTTHVAGTLDRRKALAAVTDAGQRATLAKLSGLVKTPNRLPVDLWIDGRGVLRRQKQTVALPAQKVMGVAVPSSTVTTTSDFYDFGVPVKAVAPPASSVVR